MKPPLVSVVIITYNHESFIAECLDGVLSQKTSFPFEILIGEDASTDNTREILQRYKQTYPERIRVFYRQERDKIVINGRVTGRFNFIETLKEANGKYIATLDGDDYWTSSDKLQRQVDIMESNPEIHICHHNVQIVDEMGNAFGQTFNPGKASGTIKDFVSGKIVLVHSTRLFRTKLLKFPDWFYKTAVGDLPLTLITGDDGIIFCIMEKMGAYRIHRAGIFQTYAESEKKRVVRETWNVVKSNLAYFSTDISAEVESKIFMTKFGIAKWSYREGNIQEGWKEHKRVIEMARLSPRKWTYAIKLSLDLLIGVRAHFLGLSAANKKFDNHND
jgi:glycosyltransferase involved in cell wall biosynthesis